MGVDFRRLRLGVAGKDLQVILRHAGLGEQREAGVAQGMRRDGHGDAGSVGDFFDELLDAAGRDAWTVLRIENPTLPDAGEFEVEFEVVGECGGDGDLPALAAFAFPDDDAALVRVEVIDLQVAEFGDPAAGFVEGLHHGAGPGVPFVGGVKEGFEFRLAHALDGSVVAAAWRLEVELPADFLEEVFAFVISQIRFRLTDGGGEGAGKGFHGGGELVN